VEIRNTGDADSWQIYTREQEISNEKTAGSRSSLSEKSGRPGALFSTLHPREEWRFRKTD
jgi:hypothetical protein